MSEQVITFGGGCFWCTEAVFRETKGVCDVISGYAGGETPSPTYEEVCSGTTGHAEVVQVAFDDSIISLEDVLEIFFLTHNPTTLNRQGSDVGTQYRSVVFYRDEIQREAVERVRTRIDTEKIFDHPIVTEVVPFIDFFPAESYHQRYFEKHPEAGYCQVVINPKLAAFRKKFAEKLV